MAARHKDASREALARLPKLDITSFAEECAVSTKPMFPRISARELVIRAVAYRMEEVALGVSAWSRSANCARSQRS